MRIFVVLIGFVMVFWGAMARSDGEKAGEFDYYVMALSWSANWCALEGDARGEEQCLPGKELTFTLHGLWPQFETGWPSYCRTSERDPSRADSARMADIMGSAGLAWYQWKKHGRCAGLSANDYFATARKAFDTVKEPKVFAQVNKSLKVPAAVVEEAFMAANPGLTKDMVTVTCKAGMIHEVRLCLTKALEPRVCGADTRRDCRMQDAVLGAVR